MHPQGTNSATFTHAPLDGSLTFPQLLEHHLARSPDHPAYVYDGAHGELVRVSFARYVRTVHAGCRRVLRDVPSQSGKKPVVGIFAVAETISYCMFVAAILRAGMVPFCISPRSAVEGLANMLQQTGAAAVYVSPDSRLQGAIADALALSGTQLPVLEMPTFDALQGEVDAAAPVPVLEKASLDSTALILHSSGSTSVFSKPIYLSHKMLLQYAAIPWSGSEDHCGHIFGAHNLPNFHGLGIFIGTWPFSSGCVMAVLRPTTPPMLFTPENALKGILATKPQVVISTPATIEVWSEDPVALQAMQGLKYLCYIGAPLNKRLGDALVANGVALCSAYGAMEIGLVTPFPQLHGKDWEYFTVRADCNAVRIPENEGSGMYTHAYLVGPNWATCYTNTEIDGKPGCVVSDLLEQHPTKPELHRIYGRKDDLIALSTGFKMNPGPVEAHINRNPFVDAALIFGHARNHPGVIIQVKPEFQGDLKDGEKRANILDAVWASVDEANSASPTHCQIPRAMIVLADPRRPFAVTSKLQPRRRVVFEEHKEEIDVAYH
ncbi:hypothetical protein B0H17DRAFT_1066000 [Mycena rosella]|uniref:AMP-dependent synthetase/ligase domain-containing protein n=1 Tax=Mycena rosella TaxID=1033263 RepID=A0AAD7GGK0_MYCRO|nr:hypothetical protein B0H17DRAFT_1066000 [Mycena rosella]